MCWQVSQLGVRHAQRNDHNSDCTSSQNIMLKFDAIVLLVPDLVLVEYVLENGWTVGDGCDEIGF